MQQHSHMPPLLHDGPLASKFVFDSGVLRAPASSWAGAFPVTAALAAGLPNFHLPPNPTLPCDFVLASGIPGSAASLQGTLRAFDIGLVISLTPLPLHTASIGLSGLATTSAMTVDFGTRTPEAASALQQALDDAASTDGVQFLHLPLQNNRALQQAHRVTLVAHAQRCLDANKRVWVHCWDGMCRAGLAAVAIMQECVCAWAPLPTALLPDGNPGLPLLHPANALAWKQPPLSPWLPRGRCAAAVHCLGCVVNTRLLAWMAAAVLKCRVPEVLLACLIVAHPSGAGAKPAVGTVQDVQAMLEVEQASDASALRTSMQFTMQAAAAMANQAPRTSLLTYMLHTHRDVCETLAAVLQQQLQAQVGENDTDNNPTSGSFAA